MGEPVVGFRAPFFAITADALWALDVLLEEGFHYDSSIFPVWNYCYGMPGAARPLHDAVRRLPVRGPAVDGALPRRPGCRWA